MYIIIGIKVWVIIMMTLMMIVPTLRTAMMMVADVRSILAVYIV